MFMYYLTLRPRSIGTQPEGVKGWKDYDRREYVLEVGRRVWGELYYDRRLTPDEIRNYDLIDGNGPELLRDPTGDPATDKAREQAGADYAVVFWTENLFRTIDLRSTETDEHGNLWVDGAYGNAKNYVLYDFVEGVYMMTVDALNRAYNTARMEVGSKQNTIETLKRIIRQTALRIIDREYLLAQLEARKRHADSD